MLRWLIVTALGAVLIVFVLAGEHPLSLLKRLRIVFGGGDVSSVFGDSVDYESVLVSAMRSSRDPFEAACSVAVVRLADDALPDLPPAQRVGERLRVFGGKWRETPERMKLAAAPDLLQLCGNEIDFATLGYLEQALSTPGGFVIRDWRNNVLQIYAPQVGLAAYLSYGVYRH